MASPREKLRNYLFLNNFFAILAVMGLKTPLNYRRAVSCLMAHLLETSYIVAVVLLAGCSVPASKVRMPERAAERLSQTGIASWYGPGFHGKATASGETYNQSDFTAAHQTLPLGARVRVTNLENGSATEVSINDRGPFAKGRIIDLSYSADRKSTRLNSSHLVISYAVFCLKKKKKDG